MKINVTDEEIKEVENVVLTSFFKGASVGLGVATLGNYVGNRYSTYYRSLNLPLKAFFVMALSIGWGVTKVEHNVWEYDRRKYSGEYMEKMDEIERSRADFPLKDRALFWLSDNKFKVIGATWATAVGSSLAYLYSNKFMDKTQKAIHARMYSQLITVVMIVATAGLTTSPKAAEKESYERDQWKHVLGPEPTPVLLKKSE